MSEERRERGREPREQRQTQLREQRRTPPEEPRQEEPQQPPRVEAGVRHGWWPGWIWAIPIAALIVVGWLGGRELLAGGKDITIVFPEVHGIKPNNTDVTYRGMKIGRVTELTLVNGGGAVKVGVTIDERASSLLRSGTRFYLQGATPSLGHLSSLKSMLSGPTIVMVPGAGARESRFTGLERKPIDPSPNERPLIYGITLGAAAGSLKRGDPVKLRGFTVGEVRSVGFYYDPASGEISTPGTLAIYPSLFHVKGLRAPTARAVAADIATLVSKGLRVSLARNPPLVGSYAVRLAMQPGSSGPDVLAMVDGLPQLPMASGSGGIGAVVSQFEKVPIAKIAHNALDITRHIKTLTASPHLKDAIVQLDAALRQIHTMTRQSAPRIGPLIAQLRKAAADLQRTSASADVLLNGTATQSGVHTTLRQINQAAHAIRSLADYLDRHPEALLHGRPGGPQ